MSDMVLKTDCENLGRMNEDIWHDKQYTYHQPRVLTRHDPEVDRFQ